MLAGNLLSGVPGVTGDLRTGKLLDTLALWFGSIA